ncbi:hypothetical protein B4U80_10729 [Leptotrombidium deliense]|uniref:Uncharacterized protein n=1 Tax=Leptotrombidium deliense TaxID=299467 RepID=A0A443QDK6_9ACAR|nr:hypothetical protein B4U80_10729 [Leptotrombidium deliense]
MAALQPCDSRERSGSKVFVHSHLSQCSHVFLRGDTSHPSLEKPCSGPYKLALTG